ncbi:hypothetical protein GCM10011351_29440 [Paraliobacillus quinghaiensis]|uniref:Uncharacterized protein n=1 Tax=Paraliobacillus quinghaiensis TaxID=470815 RepID=A0A917WYS0_9BACI|nr:hypothetical protein [Paraliobacillus quinghaiensis]GGM41374.1 hypothetical protein GCM10011351_29440 [Paraliobacillus quinghaiensis]
MVGVLSLILITSLTFGFVFFDIRKVLYGGIVGGLNLVVIGFVFLTVSNLNINSSAAYSISIIAALVFLTGTVTVCTLKIIEEIGDLKSD